MAATSTCVSARGYLRLKASAQTMAPILASDDRDGRATVTGVFAGGAVKKYTFDKCVKAQVPCEPDADVREFADTVTGLVADACAGRNTALFTASVAKSMAQHERTSIFLPLVKELGKRKKHFSISYGFFGITDSALVNLISEKNVPVARICANMGPLLTELIDFDELNAILEKGCMLPHFLLLQLEARSSPKTLGTLCMMDLANPCYLQPTEPSYHISASSLTKSVAAFKKVAISLSTPGYIGTIPFHESLLTTIIAPFLGVNGHATVMLNLDPTDKLSLAENEQALDFLHSVRKIRTVQTPITIDHRIPRLETTCIDLTAEISRLKAHNVTQSTALTDTNERLMHLETALADSRAQLAALQQHARDATSQHSREVERLRVEQEAALEHAREEDALALQTLREEVDARSVQVAGELKAWEAQVLGRADATRSHLEKEVVNVRGQMEKALKDAEEKRRSDLKELEERAERERLEAVEAVLSDSQLHMFAKEQDLRSAGDKIRELEAQVVALSSPSEPVSVSNMKLEVAQLTSALMTVKLEKASLETEAKHWKSEYEAVFSSFQEKSESLQALEADCAAKSTQIDVMKDELIVKKDSCASLMASLAHSQKDLEACREENSTVASAMAQLEADVSALLSKMSDRKAKYASNLAALKEESAAKLAQSVSSLRAELESQHSTEIAVLIEEHQTVMRGLRKEFSRTGLEKTSEAQSKMDEAEARMEAMERANAREVEKAQRAAKAAVQEDIKDLEARLEEAELVGTSWKRDAERLQKALHRAIEMGKQSLLDYEKEVDGERDLWDVERKTLKGRIQLLETRLATISETLKTVSSQSHKASLSDDVHKSIMIAAEIHPAAEEIKQAPRRRARMSDVSQLLEISATMGKSLPAKRASKPRNKSKIATAVHAADSKESDDEKVADDYVPGAQFDEETVASVDDLQPAPEPTKKDQASKRGKQSSNRAQKLPEPNVPIAFASDGGADAGRSELQQDAASAAPTLPIDPQAKPMARRRREIKAETEDEDSEKESQDSRPPPRKKATKPSEELPASATTITETQEDSKPEEVKKLAKSKKPRPSLALVPRPRSKAPNNDDPSALDGTEIGGKLKDSSAADLGSDEVLPTGRTKRTAVLAQKPPYWVVAGTAAAPAAEEMKDNSTASSESDESIMKASMTAARQSKSQRSEQDADRNVVAVGKSKESGGVKKADLRETSASVEDEPENGTYDGADASDTEELAEDDASISKKNSSKSKKSAQAERNHDKDPEIADLSRSKSRKKGGKKDAGNATQSKRKSKENEDEAGVKEVADDVQEDAEKVEKKKRKLAGRALAADEADEVPHQHSAPVKLGGLKLSFGTGVKSPVKKLFSFSRPSTLPAFGNLPGIPAGTFVNPYHSLGASADSSALSEFEKARAARQGMKRLEALKAAEQGSGSSSL